MLPSLLLDVPHCTRLDNSIPRHSGRYPGDAITVSAADSLPHHPTCHISMLQRHGSDLTSSIHSLLCRRRHGLGIHWLGFHGGRGSSTFTLYTFELHNSPLIFYKGKAKRLGTSSAALGLEMKAPRHIITSTRALYLHLFCGNYDFQTKKQKTITKKLEKNE